jgi:hypothetical protein
MSEPIMLSEEDLKELVELYQRARTTPMIAMSIADGLAGRDWSSLAWDKVRRKMDELGKKYGYNPRIVQIDQTTGKVTERHPDQE